MLLHLLLWLSCVRKNCLPLLVLLRRCRVVNVKLTYCSECTRATVASSSVVIAEKGPTGGCAPANTISNQVVRHAVPRWAA